jgi:hypothetical protein
MAQPIILRTQGSFFVGGKIVTGEDGDTAHIDHAYVQYQSPVDARKHPLVMWHGGGQFSKAWETTPDGRDGYQNIFLRRGFETYILDQPHRGRGGLGATGNTLSGGVYPMWDAFIHTASRIGVWIPPGPREFFPNVQFSPDAAAREQFARHRALDTCPEDHDDATRAIMADAAAALLAKIGPAILITHSNSGRYGWLTRIKSDNVRAIIAYEPACLVFPADDPPPPVSTRQPMIADFTASILVPSAAFAALSRIPIQIVFGDYIDGAAASPVLGLEFGRIMLHRAIQFRDAVNRRGGQVEILRLPDAGLFGNTHAPFADLNNIQVADLLSEFLERHHLDERPRIPAPSHD